MTDTASTTKAANRSGLSRLLASSYFWALLFAVAIAAWMASGHLVIGGSADSTAGTSVEELNKKTKSGESAKLFKVRAQTFHARPRQAILTLRGRTEADAKVMIRAETSGVVTEVAAQKGALVEQGTLLCRIETAAREAVLLEAKAALAQSEADFAASNQLAKRGHTAKLKVAEMQAKRDAAKAAIARAELDLARVEIKAPFRGIIEEQPAKKGDFLNIGGICAHLIAADPLVIVGNVAEGDVTTITPGMTANARLFTGEQVEGKVRFVSAASDATTRTFRIEIEVANPDFALRDGVTADIRIPLQSTKAHQFSPAILSLDDEGRIGVRAIHDGNKVKFMPVRLLGEDKGGVWVAGLPDRVTVITVGQDYVIDGQEVIVEEINRAKSS